MRRKQPKLEVRNPRLSPVSDIFKDDESAIYLIGSPGYRVARGRSGLGWIETQAELARFEGLIIHWLVTGKFFSTKEPTVLFGAVFSGIFLAVIPLALILSELVLTGDLSALAAFIMGIPGIAIGAALLIGAMVNIMKLTKEAAKAIGA